MVDARPELTKDSAARRRFQDAADLIVQAQAARRGGDLEPVDDAVLPQPVVLREFCHPAQAALIAAAARRGNQNGLPLVGDIKIEKVGLRPLQLQQLTVGIERNGGLVGIDRHPGHRLGPVRITLAAQMDEGLVGEPGFIGIERVFFIAPVECHKALVILPVLAALAPGVGAEVEHIPDIGAPEIGPGEELQDE